MSLRATNLNLLPILRALLTEASITRAAATLGLSQPATSHALGRLRALLGDPLLVQVGRTMRLTPRAEELRARVDGVCTSIEDILLDTAFVPARVRRAFTIATADYMTLSLAPDLLRLFAETAPGASLRFADVGPDFRTHLAQGAIDVAVVAKFDAVMRGFRIRDGYRDELIGVAAADHPLARAKRIGAAELARYPRFGVDATLHGPVAAEGAALLMTGGDGALRLSASHLLALPLLIAETQATAVLPRTLADRVSDMAGLFRFPLPGAPPPFDLCVMWSPLHDADPAHRWFRDVLDGVMRRRFAG